MRDLTVAHDVLAALSAGRPVVALESTVIAHGLPRPDNLALARDLERIVRDHGAVPATVAVLGGRLRVGLEDRELEHLAGGDDILKLGRRDLAIALATGHDGATTVAGTLFVAQAAGIRVMATGGIGGVHRGGGTDVSADLPELAATPMVVVCAGAKAILDLPATLEWLETHGIPVIGYQTDRFPAFYSRDSGHGVDARVEAPAEVAAIARAAWENGLRSAVLVTVPCPPDDALPGDEMESAVERAVGEAARRGLHGKALTPFLLVRVGELTGGRSRKANLALLRHNARIAAGIASALCT